MYICKRYPVYIVNGLAMYPYDFSQGCFISFTVAHSHVSMSVTEIHCFRENDVGKMSDVVRPAVRDGLELGTSYREQYSNTEKLVRPDEGKQERLTSSKVISLSDSNAQCCNKIRGLFV